MLQLAYCSPVNPVASGISDYSEELLPFLGQYAAITVFAEGNIRVANPQLQAHLAMHPLDRLPAMHQQQPFDAIIYHMGNSPAHGEIYELLQRVPGVVVLHDWVLHHFMLWYAAERQHNIGLYMRTMQQRYGAAGTRVARLMSRGQLHDRAFDMPLNEDVIAHARGLIGHSHFVVDQVRAMRPGLPAAMVAHGVPLPPLVEPAAARARLGLPLDVPIWASFGHITPYKQIDSALRAFARFRHHHPTARYLLVGSVSPHYDLPALVQQLDLAGAVTTTGYVSQTMFGLYVAAADLCLNLRAPTAGETSGSLLRLLAAARPTLVSAIGAFNELPNDVCAKVDPDRSQEALILAYARLFQLQPALAAQLGHNARHYVATHHTLQGAARGYMELLAQVYGWDTIEKVRPSLWDIGGAAQETAASRSAQQPSGAAASSLILPGVAQAAAELGIRPTDDAALQQVAVAMGELC